MDKSNKLNMQAKKSSFCVSFACFSLVMFATVLSNNNWAANANPANKQLSEECPKQASGPSNPEFLKSEILTAHNKYRGEVGVKPIVWSDKLALDALNWANYLASLGGGILVHSDTQQGENLWSGTQGGFSYTNMVDQWGCQKRYFKQGRFPDVTTGGTVGHYTQIIWRRTTQIGCATAQAGGNDILVCRYNPAGNVEGELMY
jgi:Cysteine-rich secretory protein family